MGGKVEIILVSSQACFFKPSLALSHFNFVIKMFAEAAMRIFMP
jgi:hypothetical protein